MFIINLTYKAPIEKVDEAREEHIKFLQKYYAQSIFLASGPKVPRSGGIILAQEVSRVELETIIQEDPFWIKQIAEYEIIEFSPTMQASALSGLLK
ncbi:YciI family protein [Bacillus sp. BRMEA1]|uniref:YciI family protein n=1 Tax=Neobacillus endophyticus TaxID=2738405 RepID=UPI001565FD0F|nr:YciI family protein [Neobacillus endophyticus]NRD78006.1 YciI family protein [Neobacillus endophyticus]